jgi:hypothetical protein
VDHYPPADVTGRCWLVWELPPLRGRPLLAQSFSSALPLALMPQALGILHTHHCRGNLLRSRERYGLGGPRYRKARARPGPRSQTQDWMSSPQTTVIVGEFPLVQSLKVPQAAITRAVNRIPYKPYMYGTVIRVPLPYRRLLSNLTTVPYHGG